MTPNQIHALVIKRFPELTTEPRRSPDGWAYFLGTKRGGSSSNRIFRAVATSPHQPARLKRSVSSRLEGTKETDFTGSAAELEAIIREEITLYRQQLENAR